MPQYFDSHCHFDFDDFNDDRNAIWEDCQTLGINRLLIPGTTPKSWRTVRELCQTNDGMLMAAGIHPWWVNDTSTIDKSLKDQWQQILALDYCRAIGECGLDKFIDTPIDVQLDVFEVHLQLACDTHMPLIIHVRKTHNETLQRLQHYKPSAGGVIHGFSGSVELAKQYWQLGFYIGIGGTITYTRAHKTRACVKEMPLDALLLETDAPDMPLHGYQGQRNSPLRLIEVAQTLADIRKESIDSIANTTYQNSNILFQL